MGSKIHKGRKVPGLYCGFVFVRWLSFVQYKFLSVSDKKQYRKKFHNNIFISEFEVLIKYQPKKVAIKDKNRSL